MNRWKKLAIISSLCLLPSISGLAYEQKAIYEKPDGSNIGARTTFGYKDDSMFKVNTKPGFVTDIQLREGEELTYVAGGDTKSWLIDKAKVGSVQHVYIKPLEPGKHTNIIINTDMHTYRLDVWSSMDAFDPLITFAFMGDRKAQQSNGFATENFLPPVGKQLNKDYTIKAKKMEKYSELIPASIVDDGQRTYIRIPDTNKYDMPVLYMVNPWDGKQTLVNYRVQGGYFVVDAVMAHGRLFYHQKFKVDFYNNAKQHSMSVEEKINNERDVTSRRLSEWRMNDTEPSTNSQSYENPVEDEVYVAPKQINQNFRPQEPVNKPITVSTAPKNRTAVADMVAKEAETGKKNDYKRPEVEGLFEQPIIEVRGYGPGQSHDSNVVKYVPPFVSETDNRDAIKAQMAQEKAQRVAQEKLEAQRRLEQERAIAQANADRIAREKEQARLIKEREAQMLAQQAEQERIQKARIAEQARMQAEQEKLQKARLAEQEKLQKAKMAEQARLEKARLAEQARVQAEQEKMRKAQLAEQAKLEKARQAELQRQQAEQLKAEQARQAELARQQKEQEKLEKARIAEYNRQQAEKAKAEQLRQAQLQKQQMEQMKAEQARQAQLEKERIANEKRMEKERQAQIRAQEAQMRAQQAEQARLQAEQQKAQQVRLAQQQARAAQQQVQTQRQQVTPTIDKNFVQQVDNIHGPVQVMLSDGRVVPMREDQFRKLPLESRVQLVAQNRVRRG